MTFNELSEMEAEVKRQAAASALLGAKYALKWAIQYLEKARATTLAYNALQTLQGVDDLIWVIGYHPSNKSRGEAKNGIADDSTGGAK